MFMYVEVIQMKSFSRQLWKYSYRIFYKLDKKVDNVEVRTLGLEWAKFGSRSTK